MQKTQPPIFGENGAILNADEMQPQKDWPKPEPQGLTRKQWIVIVVHELVLMTALVVGLFFL